MAKTRNYECPVCGMRINNPQAMKVHIQFKHFDEYEDLYGDGEQFVPEKIDDGERVRTKYV